jgi:hypothetical protein
MERARDIYAAPKSMIGNPIASRFGSDRSQTWRQSRAHCGSNQPATASCACVKVTAWTALASFCPISRRGSKL